MYSHVETLLLPITQAERGMGGGWQASLLHLVPALGGRGRAAQPAFRFLRQLLYSGMSIDVCVVLLCNLWLARRSGGANASGTDEIMETLGVAIRNAAAVTTVSQAEGVAAAPVAAAAAMHKICEVAPREGLAFVSVLVGLLRGGMETSTQQRLGVAEVRVATKLFYCDGTWPPLPPTRVTISWSLLS